MWLTVAAGLILSRALGRKAGPPFLYHPLTLQIGRGTFTDKIEVEYPIGHRRRREQGIPLLIEKFERNLATQFSESRCSDINSLCSDQSKLESTAVNEFMNLFVME
mgnify:CR=1 FL=1